MRKIKPKSPKEAKAEMAPTPSYPSFGLDLEHLPEARDWEIGKTYQIGLQVKLTGLDLSKQWEHVRFDVMGTEVQKANKKKSKAANKKVSRYID